MPIYIALLLDRDVICSRRSLRNGYICITTERGVAFGCGLYIIRLHSISANAIFILDRQTNYTFRCIRYPVFISVFIYCVIV